MCCIPNDATLASKPSALMREWSFLTSSFSFLINCRWGGGGGEKGEKEAVVWENQKCPLFRGVPY